MSKTRFIIVLLITFLGACVPHKKDLQGEPMDTPFTSPIVITPVVTSPILTTPIIPDDVPAMMENQWRLTDIKYNGANRDFASIHPVLLTFQPGIFFIRACNSTSFESLTTDIEEGQQYRLIRGLGTLRGCPQGGTEQERILYQALSATNRYNIVENTLILYGKGIQLDFVLDNEAMKPPDWS